MSAAHTPGPWAIDPDDRPGMGWNNHIVQAARPHFAICFMTHSGKPDNSECEANARLIAAAPELLEALAALLPLAEDAAPRSCGACGTPMASCDMECVAAASAYKVYGQARAALKKAREG